MSNETIETIKHITEEIEEKLRDAHSLRRLMSTDRNQEILIKDHRITIKVSLRRFPLEFLAVARLGRVVVLSQIKRLRRRRDLLLKSIVQS